MKAFGYVFARMVEAIEMRKKYYITIVLITIVVYGVTHLWSCQPVGKNASKKIHVYDPIVDEFFLVGETVHGRSDATGICFGDNIVLTDGWLNREGKVDFSIEVFDTISNESQIIYPNILDLDVYTGGFSVAYKSVDRLKYIELHYLNGLYSQGEYNPSDNTWTNTSLQSINLIDEIHVGSARVGMPNKVIYFGGMPLDKNISELNLDNGEWRKIGEFTNILTETQIAQLDNTVYILGETTSNLFLTFDLQTYTIEEKSGLPRAGKPRSAVVHEGYLYIFGFEYYQYTGYERECYRFNLDTEIWERIHDLPNDARGGPAVVCNGKIYLY